MPENSWYVEGSCLDRFLNGEIYLERPHQNKILIVVNKADRQSINAVSGARATIGSNAEIVELEKPIELIASALNKPVAHGPVDYAIPGFEEVVDPRKAIEIVTLNFIHCLLKGLHKAPRLTRTKRNGSHWASRTSISWSAPWAASVRRTGPAWNAGSRLSSCAKTDRF